MRKLYKALSIATLSYGALNGALAQTTYTGYDVDGRNPANRTNSLNAYNQFLVAVSTLGYQTGEESFESYSTNTLLAIPSWSFTPNFAPQATRASGLAVGEGLLGLGVNAGNPPAFYATHGVNYLRIAGTGPYLEITFTDYVWGFGAFIISAEGFTLDRRFLGNAAFVTFADDTQESYLYGSQVYTENYSSLTFWGIISPSKQIKKVRLVSFGAGDDIVFDQLTVVVPEPASLLALGVGLAGAAGLRRRRG
ncbi:MAG: PEP-CTERM sorting domain-containing protein [Fimbriimonadales bacterium]|nr:PEP-CTERM sorting domain-containing protein [Fimbriimonadales bacterium]